MESVRDIISRMKYDVRSEHESRVPLPSWNRYPCSLQKRCENNKQQKCIGYVSIFINTEKIRWLYLEITFIREMQRAFIRVDCLQMQKLLELGIVTDNQLERITL